MLSVETNVWTITLSALVGALSALLVNWVARRGQRQDTLRQWRADTYRDFVQATHDAAHRLGVLALDGRGTDLSDDDNWRLDSSARRNLRAVELVSSARLRGAAIALTESLRSFREVVRTGAEYKSEEYEAALNPYRDARAAFASAARKELGIRDKRPEGPRHTTE